MEKIRLILLKILLLTAIVAILSASAVDAKKHKKNSVLSKEHVYGTEKHHKKIKRSAYDNWAKTGNYGLPPYLVYNRKLGAYYPYFKYPENSLRRNLRKIYKQYTANKKYSTLPQEWTRGV